MALGLSIRAAGEVAGVSHTAIRKAAKAGHLRVLPDGTIDPAGISEWKTGRRAPRGGNRKGDTESVSTDRPKAEAARALEIIMSPGGIFATRAEAEKARDSFVAHLRRLEYETKRGKLIEIERAAQGQEQDYAEVRTKLLAVPPEWAPRMFRCKTILELQDLLTILITETLDVLSRGGTRKPGD